MAHTIRLEGTAAEFFEKTARRLGWSKEELSQHIVEAGLFVVSELQEGQTLVFEDRWGRQRRFAAIWQSSPASKF